MLNQGKSMCKFIHNSFISFLFLSTLLFCAENHNPELIQGGNNENGVLNASNWTIMIDTGKSLDLSVANCATGKCIHVNPYEANAGMYQAIQTEIGQRYKLEAKILGANHYKDKSNYTLGASYLTVEDKIPTATSTVTHNTEKIQSNTVTTVGFTFTATSTTTYVSLRGDTRHRYPTASSISVKKVDKATTYEPFVWHNISTNIQNGIINASFSAKPSNININSVIGFSNGESNAYTDLGIIVRFSPMGIIDARNGSKYQATNTLKYQSNKQYDFRLEINFDIQKYSIYVTAEDENEILIGKNYAFRSEQSSLTSINNMAHYSTENGVVSVDNLIFTTTKDTTSPIITLNDASIITLMVGDVYTDAGAIATDNKDGEITANIIIDNRVISSIAGTYKVTYEVYDDAGNKANAERTVIVKERDGSHVSNKHVDVLTIGDSFTDGADYLIPLTEKLKNLGHHNISFVGTEYDREISHEGREGWTAAAYMNHNPKWYPDSPFLNNNTIDFENYFKEKLEVKPHIVIVQLGLNDVISATKGVLKGYSKRDNIIEKKIADITLLINTIKQSLPQSKILMMMPTEQNENEHTNTNASAIGVTNKDLHRKLMGEYQEQYLAKFDNREKENIYILKTYSYLNTKQDFRDFIHPNMQGFKKIAEALKDKLLSLVSSIDQQEEASAMGQKIFEIDFNKHPIGTYTKAMHREDFYTYKGENLYYKNHDNTHMFGNSGPDETTSIIEDNGEKVLRVLYKKDKIGLGKYPDTSTYTGFASFAALPKKNRREEDVNNPQEVTLTYYVKFERRFDWAIGGKLPGLAGGVAPGGGQKIGNHKMQNGFSARFMWHMLSTPDNTKIPGLIGYIYHPGRVGDVGQHVYGAGSYMSTIKPTTSFTDRNKANLFVFKREKWYKIKQTIKPNRPYKSDGTMKVWIDDKLATNYGGMKYIADGKHGEYSVDRLLFATFHGGGTQEYAPKYDSYARFKDIEVYVK